MPPVLHKTVTVMLLIFHLLCFPCLIVSHLPPGPVVEATETMICNQFPSEVYVGAVIRKKAQIALNGSS